MKNNSNPPPPSTIPTSNPFRLPLPHKYSQQSPQGTPPYPSYTCTIYNDYSTYNPYNSNHSLEIEERHEEESNCASIENGIFQGLLRDLREEISLKSQALKYADLMVKKMERVILGLQAENQELRDFLDQAQKKIAVLEAKPGPSITSIKEQSPSRRSVTRTYFSEKKLPLEAHHHHLNLTIISAQVFNEFSKNYNEMMNQLNIWLQQQKQSEQDIVSKLQSTCFQAQQLLSSPNLKHDQDSKTTYDSTHNDHQHHYSSSYPYPSSTSSSTSACQLYQQTILKYRQLCSSLSSQIQDCHTCINTLNGMLQQGQQILQVDTPMMCYVPPELVKMVTRECNQIVCLKVLELKKQNLELVRLIEDIIQWICTNSKDGGKKFKQVFGTGFG